MCNRKIRAWVAVIFSALLCGFDEVAGEYDAAIAVVRAAAIDDPAYLIINEHHDVDAHRHISACLIDAISKVRTVVFAGEALPDGRVRDIGPLTRSPGYTGSTAYQDIWRATFVRGLPSYGYDPDRRSYLSAAELRAAGLTPTTPNRRDRVAARRLEAIRIEHAPALVFVHVGHSHVSERWTVSPEGAHGWLAAHIHQISSLDPITVYQMTPDRAARYIESGDFRFGLADCGPQQASLLRLGEGVVGCVDRIDLSSTEDTDFIFLHPFQPGDRFRRKNGVCELGD